MVSENWTYWHMKNKKSKNFEKNNNNNFFKHVIVFIGWLEFNVSLYASHLVIIKKTKMFKFLFVLLTVPFILFILLIFTVTIIVSAILERKQKKETEHYMENDELGYCISH